LYYLYDEFAWVVSRHNEWKECKKQYYFDEIKKYVAVSKDGEILCPCGRKLPASQPYNMRN